MCMRHSFFHLVPGRVCHLPFWCHRLVCWFLFWRCLSPLMIKSVLLSTVVKIFTPWVSLKFSIWLSPCPVIFPALLVAVSTSSTVSSNLSVVTIGGPGLCWGGMRVGLVGWPALCLCPWLQFGLWLHWFLHFFQYDFRQGLLLIDSSVLFGGFRLFVDNGVVVFQFFRWDDFVLESDFQLCVDFHYTTSLSFYRCLSCTA